MTFSLMVREGFLSVKLFLFGEILGLLEGFKFHWTIVSKLFFIVKK